MVCGIQWIYPLYQSSQDVGPMGNPKRQSQWVIYWAFCALYTVIEKVLRFDMIPFYFEIKAILFLWLVHPQFFGASWIWYNHAAQFFPLLDDPVQKVLTEHNLITPAQAQEANKAQKFDDAQGEGGGAKKD